MEHYTTVTKQKIAENAVVLRLLPNPLKYNNLWTIEEENLKVPEQAIIKLDTKQRP